MVVVVFLCYVWPLEAALFLFLCVQGGDLVAVVRGPNPPLLQKMIVEELAKEKKVLEQDIKRIVVSSMILQSSSSHMYPELHITTHLKELWINWCLGERTCLMPHFLPSELPINFYLPLPPRVTKFPHPLPSCLLANMEQLLPKILWAWRLYNLAPKRNHSELQHRFSEFFPLLTVP